MRELALSGPSAPGLEISRPGLLDRAWRRVVMGQLALLDRGRLRLHDRGEEVDFGESGGESSSALAATVTVRHPEFFRSLVVGGSLGAAESFLRGEWTCDDLTSLFRIFIQNPQLNYGLDRFWNRWMIWAARGWHRLHRNSPAGSRRNIHAHYDLGNEFFSLFLDETLAYSSGVFDSPQSSLFEASVAKFDRICRLLQLSPDDHLLEIGTGWGGLAMHAARNYGCRVTTTTISREQYNFSAQRIAAAGLEDRITLLQQDYRDLTGRYDKLVSVEMIEAVGLDYLDAYFGQCGRLLEPHGAMVIQAIVMPEQRFEQYRRSVDFIQRYIFPGGALPSVGAMLASAGRTTDLRLVHLDDIAPHYARTLRVWYDRFLERVDDVRGLGFPEQFIRMWRYYLNYCEAAFLEREVGTVQMLLAKPSARNSR